MLVPEWTMSAADVARNSKIWTFGKALPPRRGRAHLTGLSRGSPDAVPQVPRAFIFCPDLRKDRGRRVAHQS